ncbi:MAG TPA: hypothetical protein DCM05_10850 [Elusimicrobia bacterium]|nr:hypothetical protein [Elusimicrobiota bacterium]
MTDRTGRPFPAKAVLAAALLLTFLSFLFSPFYMKHLRAKFARQLPQEWEKVTNNGSYAHASPLLITAKNIEEGIYAIKVRQAYRHGFPYDPYLGDRTLKSWMFDCLMFYPIVPFVWLAGGDLQQGWVLAAAVFATLWVFFLYRVFLRWGQDEALALLWAVGAFFFIDTFLHVVKLFHLGPRAWPNWLFLLFASTTGQVQFMRLPSPGLTLLMSALLLSACLALAASRERRLGLSILAGLGTGLLCFVHPFEWMYGVGTLALFLVLAWTSGLPVAGRSNLLAALVPASVVSAGYYALSSAMTREVMADIVSRVGSVERRFHWQAVFFLLAAAAFWSKARREQGGRRWAWCLLSAGCGVCFLSGGFSLVLGYDVQVYGHMTLIGGLSVLLALLGWSLEHPQRLGWFRRHSAVLVAAVFAWVFLREKAWSDTHYKIFGTPRHIEEAARWVQGNIPGAPLVVSISAIATQQLALNTDVRALVTDGSSSYGMPASTESLLRGFAKTIKAAGADPEKLLQDRWDDFLRRDTLKQQTAYFTRNVSLERAEQATWPAFLANYGSGNRELLERMRSDILRYHAEESPPPKPYYLWLGPGDDAYLLRTPESAGGQLLYDHRGVRVFGFAP